MKDPKCPFCNGKSTIQMSYEDGWEFMRNCECSKCYALFREVYAMKFDRVETMRKPTRRFDNDREN